MTTTMKTRDERGVLQSLTRLGKLLKRGQSVSTTAPRAPWNRTGKRFWAVTDRAGKVLLVADTAKALEQKIRQSGRQVKGA